MIYRDYSASAINLIANHPQVASTFGYNNGEPLDFSEVAARKDDHVILTDGARIATVSEWSAPNVWQVHIMVTPDARGAYARDATRECIDFMFDQMGAEKLWAQIGGSIIRKTEIFARMVGLRPVGMGRHQVIGPVVYYEAKRW